MAVSLAQAILTVQMIQCQDVVIHHILVSRVLKIVIVHHPLLTVIPVINFLRIFSP